MIRRVQLALFDAAEFSRPTEPAIKLPRRIKRKVMPCRQLDIISFLQSLTSESPFLRS